MNAWPTLREWMQFGGTLALELVIVFAVAKLVTLRVRSAQGRRALWQITLLAMLLVSVGELNGVRGWLRLPEKKTPSPDATTRQKVIVTFKDVEPGPDLFPEFAPAEILPPPALRPSRWQERAMWPALLWAACAALVLLRMIVAQGLALRLRLASHRSSGQPDPLNLSSAEGTADMAARNSARACRNSDPVLLQRLDVLARALGLRRKVALLTSQRTVAPFTFGVWRPVIVLPKSFSTTFTREQQDAALAHELAHVAGFDSAWRTLSQGICAVLWWHPLAWLAKRELDHASELVADEASLLVVNGPDRLAECLLACAKELRRPALAGWLGMDGGGFRSALGKRVTRLLQLNPHARLSRPVPWYFRLLAPVVCVALLWLGMAAVMKFDAPRGGAWRASILGSAFAAAAEAADAKQVVVDRAKLLQELHEQGTTYAESPAGKLQTPAATPTNSATVSNLSDIPLLGRFFTNQESNRAGSGLRTSPKRQAIYDKLRSIRLSEWGPIDSLPLSEVIRELSAETRRLHPEHQGVNFILSGLTAENFGDTDALGRSIEPVDVKTIVIRLGSAVKNLTLEEVLNIMVKIADRKIKYSVEDYGVLISPAVNEPTTLHTRFLHMDSNDFQRVLQSVPREMTNATAKSPDDVPFGRRVDSEFTNRLHFLTEVTPAEVVIPGMRNWFKSLGVDLTKAGKAVFYNDRLGMLMIRATPEDLDTIGKAFQPLGIKPGAKFLDGRAATGEPRNVPEQDQIEAAKLVQDGKLFYEIGQLHAARTNLQAALRFQPTNQGALYYLDLVNTRELAVRAKLKDLRMEPMDTWTNQVQDASNTNLQTRFFKVDPNTLEQGLKSISTHDPSGGGRKPVFNPYDTNSVIERVQRLFQAAGVDLSAPGRALFYKDRVGTIMVRATATELDTIEKAIQLLNMTPPQLTIRVKVFEIAKTNATQSLDWFLGSALTNPPPRSRVDPNAAVPTITGILTDWQFREVVRALEQRGGTDLLSAPEVTTLSGRQAQIKVVDIKYVVTDLDIGETNATRRQPEILPIAEPFELGPVLDVVPYVQPDGYTIQMTVIPSLKEFLGYEDPKTVQPAIAGAAQANGTTQSVPLPKFRLRQVATSAMVWDGQTLVIGAGSARTMQRDRGANGVITTNYTEKELIFFITPRLIDPAGNPLHPDDELPLRHKTVPGQPVDSLINEGRRNVVKP